MLRRSWPFIAGLVFGFSITAAIEGRLTTHVLIEQEAIALRDEIRELKQRAADQGRLARILEKELAADE